MGTNKLMDKLNNFFDLSENKQKTKQEKLLKIIHKLEEKKTALEQKMIKQSEIDETIPAYHEMSEELKVLSKLIKKAKKHSISD